MPSPFPCSLLIRKCSWKKTQIEKKNVRARRYRDKHGGGLIEFIKNGFISKRLKEYETKQSEDICSELTIANRKWICLNILGLQTQTSLSKAEMKHENIIIMDDFNIDIKKKGLGYGKLDTFCDLFNLTNSVHSETCLMKNHKCMIDWFLTNKPISFFKTHTTRTGLSDYHKLIYSIFKSKAPRLKPKVIFIETIKNLMKRVF